MNERWPDQFRLVGAIALAIAFFLPVSSCTGSLTVNSASEKAIGFEAGPEVAADNERRYRYPYKMLSIDNPMSPVIVLGYFWPAATSIYRKVRVSRKGLKITILEAVLCLLSIYVVLVLAFFETLEYGGYLAFGGAALCLLASSKNLFDETRRWWRESRSEGVSHD